MEKDCDPCCSHNTETVLWTITGKCNFRCRHCFMSAPHAAEGEPTFEELMQMLNETCEKAYACTDIDPWDRYSIAVGMSEWADEEMTYVAAFSRADKAMYIAKREFKQNNGGTESAQEKHDGTVS